MNALYGWLATLDPGFALLVALPFAVAAAAFAGDAVREALRGRRQAERSGQQAIDTRFKRRVWGL